MAKRCGCASDACSCYLSSGDGVTVSGGGTQTNPYVVDLSDAGRVLTVQNENTLVLSGVATLDFQGGSVNAVTGDTGEVVVTVPQEVALVAAGTTDAAILAMGLPDGVIIYEKG